MSLPADPGRNPVVEEPPGALQLTVLKMGQKFTLVVHIV